MNILRPTPDGFILIRNARPAAIIERQPCGLLFILPIGIMRSLHTAADFTDRPYLTELLK